MQHAPRRSKNAFRSDKKKKRDVAGSALPSTVHRPGGPPKPPQDHSVKGKKPDVMGLLHFAEETVGGVFGMLKAANTNSTDHAKAQPPAPASATGLDPKIKDAMDNVRAIAETQTLIATMGKVGDQRGRWQFLNTLDRVDDPAVRAKMKKQFEEQTGQTLDHFIDTAGFYSKRDREQAKDMLSDERGETEKKLAEQARSDPEAYEKKKLQAIKWASTVLQTTRKDDVDHDSDAKPIYDALGPRTPEEIELIRAEIRKQTGGRTAYQEIDKTLSGGTEDEALAGLKGNKVNAVAAGIKNADGNAKRIEELLRTLSPDEITKLNVTSPVTTIIAIQSIEPSQRGTIGALLSNDKASADAAHIADLFKKPEDGLEMDGIKLTKQSEQNLENRKPDNIIKELRAMSPEAIRAAKDAWNKDPANKDKQWSEMIEERFEGGDSNMLMRIRALSEGNLVEERAYALREGMRKQNQEMIEGALANPDLDSKDEEKKAKAIAEKQELEATVLRLDVEANRGAAAMTGKDPNAVVGRPMEAQLADYYEEYGDKIPKPKDLDSMLELAKGEERLKAKRRAEASENHVVTNEIVETGDVSQVTKVIRAEKKGDLETKAQLLENLESKDERVKLEEEYKKRFPADSGKGIYDDPRAKEFAAMADFKKRMGDERPLSEIQKEIADDGRNANEHRIHNVALHGAKVERSPYLEYTLQAEQLERQHSDSLESSEMMRDMMGGNAGTEDLARHQLQNMKESFVEKTNPFDMTPPNLKEGVSEAEFRERDKSMTSTLEVQRSEKIKHGERLAMAFSTIAKIAALLAGQPHLVFLIDAAAGLTEMAIKSAAMGNDYDSSLDEKMFGLTMAVDALTMGAGKYFSGAASKLDDVVAAEKAGARVGVDVAEQAVTSEAKKEIAEEGIKQAAKAEAKVAGSVMKSADDTVEGGMAMAKTESAIAKAESTIAKETVEDGTEKALKSLARKEMAANVGIGMIQTGGASMIQGENTDDMLMGLARSFLGAVIPAKLGDKIDDVFGKGAIGTVLKAGVNMGSDLAQGGDVGMAALGAGVNAHRGIKANKKTQGGSNDEHVMSHLAEDAVSTPRSDIDAPARTANKLSSETVDPNVLAHGHNAEPDHLVTANNPAYTPQVEDPRQAPKARTVAAPAGPTEQTPIGTRAEAPETKVRPDLTIEREPRQAPSLDGLSTEQRINSTTGVDKGPEYHKAQQDLASFYANQEIEAANATHVRGSHFEEGNPSNAWNSSYSVREFSYDNATLTQLGIDIHLTPGKAVTDADLAAVRANTYRGVDQYLNFDEDGRLHQLPNGNVLHVEPNFVDRPDTADVAVKVDSGRRDPDTNRPRRTRMDQWLLDDVVPPVEGPGLGPVVPTHELLHVTGQKDEYIEPEIKNRQSIDSEGVKIDGSIMGDLYHEGGTPELKQRHLNALGADIDKHRNAAADTLKMPAATDDDAQQHLHTKLENEGVISTDPAAETLRFPAQDDVTPELDNAAQAETVKQMSDSGRNTTPLTPAEIEYARTRSVDLGMPADNIVISADDPSARTSWGQAFGQERLYIADDVRPAVPHQNSSGEWVSLSANQRVSMDGALGHEIIGHREADLAGQSKTQSYEQYSAMDPETRQTQAIHDNALDEAQASLRAAKFTPGLTNKERKVLFQDAMERLAKVGLSVDDVPDLDLYLDQQ